VITQLEVVVQEKENQMVELQNNIAELQTRYSQVEAAFEEEKLQQKENYDTLVQLKEVCTFRSRFSDDRL